MMDTQAANAPVEYWCPVEVSPLVAKARLRGTAGLWQLLVYGDDGRPVISAHLTQAQLAATSVVLQLQRDDGVRSASFTRTGEGDEAELQHELCHRRYLLESNIGEAVAALGAGDLVKALVLFASVEREWGNAMSLYMRLVALHSPRYDCQCCGRTYASVEVAGRQTCIPNEDMDNPHVHTRECFVVYWGA